MRRVTLTLTLALLAGPVWAHDHARPDLDSWYRSLRVPETHSGFAKGWGCCDKTDCAPRAVRYLPGGIMEARGDNGVWAPVPPESIIRDKGNPYPMPVVCIIEGKVACVVEGIGF